MNTFLSILSGAGSTNLTIIIITVIIAVVIFLILKKEPGVKCPRCLSHGIIKWVLPGKNCPNCGHPC